MSVAPVQSSLLCSDGLAHGFFTRAGGVSTEAYAGLNCGIGSADNAVHVQKNRSFVQEYLGADALLSLSQIHSADVVTVTQPWEVAQRPSGDAMVTNQRGIALGILTADCVPVLFADMHAGVIGAAHAGWKGALAGVTDATIIAMETLGAQRERMVVAIGPCIAQASYEVSAAFLEPFLAVDAENARFFMRDDDGHYWFDVRGYVAQRVADAGVKHVDVLPHDTYALEADFYSYRRSCHRGETDYGRQISAIMLGL
jgi:YfiH family protein